jgi:hypothetical protein
VDLKNIKPNWLKAELDKTKRKITRKRTKQWVYGLLLAVPCGTYTDHVVTCMVTFLGQFLKPARLMNTIKKVFKVTCNYGYSAINFLIK